MTQYTHEDALMFMRGLNTATAERDRLDAINADLLKCLTAVEQRASDLYHCNRALRERGLDDIRRWVKAAEVIGRARGWKS